MSPGTLGTFGAPRSSAEPVHLASERRPTGALPAPSLTPAVREVRWASLPMGRRRRNQVSCGHVDTVLSVGPAPDPVPSVGPALARGHRAVGQPRTGSCAVGMRLPGAVLGLGSVGGLVHDFHHVVNRGEPNMKSSRWRLPGPMSGHPGERLPTSPERHARTTPERRQRQARCVSCGPAGDLTPCTTTDGCGERSAATRCLHPEPDPPAPERSPWSQHRDLTHGVRWLVRVQRDPRCPREQSARGASSRPDRGPVVATWPNDSDAANHPYRDAAASMCVARGDGFIDGAWWPGGRSDGGAAPRGPDRWAILPTCWEHVR